MTGKSPEVWQFVSLHREHWQRSPRIRRSDLPGELLEAIAKTLVDHPEEVKVRSVEGQAVTMLELRVHPTDLGKVIGRQGRTAKSIRTILGAAGMKLRKRLTLEILE